MNGMKAEKRGDAFRQLVEQIKSDSRSDSAIARMTGVSQPTVSRLRKAQGERTRDSKSFNKLCSFYGIAIDVGKRRGGYNELLCSAIIDAWDGTESHGRALLDVIKGLKGLQCPEHRKAGG